MPPERPQIRHPPAKPISIRAALGVASTAAIASAIFVTRPHAVGPALALPYAPSAAQSGAAPSPPPSPSAAAATASCPDGARLVERDHADVVDHDCIDLHGKHCFAYQPGVTRTSGEVAHVRVCMDVYEAPNVRGERPLVMRSGLAAAAYCAERRKRLCTEAEWESACEGEERRPWVYGWSANGTACNSGKNWRPFDEAALSAGGPRAEAEVSRLWQGAPSGSFAACISQDGVMDLVGNVEEWVTSRPERRFRAALMGGFWAKPWTGCRGTNDAHDPSFKFYEVGFRCCKEAGARP